MGLIEFVKDAGAKLGLGEKDPTQAEEFQERRKGNLLAQHIMKLELKIDDLKVDFDDGVATIQGKTELQAEREKAVLAVGNVEGVSQVDDMIQVIKAEPAATYHTVVRGDTLSKLAKTHYGDAMKYPMIFEANRPMLSDPDKIYVGQVLRIPTLDQ
ncbi:MAG: peptidoglycan-binding protein LysM [Gemmatimonadales bacterium]|jgi:nucleoid-associated protein YgaU